MEEWRECHCTSLYEISNLGHVRRTKTQELRTLHPNRYGYNCVTLNVKGKSDGRLVAQLVLRAFVGPPQKDQTADHIDNKQRRNDSLTNLRWASKHLQNDNRSFLDISRAVRASSFEDEYFTFSSITEASDELCMDKKKVMKSILMEKPDVASGLSFRYVVEKPSNDALISPIPDMIGYYASSDGLVRRKGGSWTRGSRHGSYFRTELSGKQHYVQRLVALAFIGPLPGGHMVDHKDGDGTNNNIQNLEYVTHAENCKRAYITGNRVPPNQKPVNQYTRDGKFIAQHESESKAARSVGSLDPSAISECCSGKRNIHKEFIWKHVDKDESQDTIMSKKAKLA
ncbi:unnamed protein product [Phaeothamnion confervicola]